MITISASRGSSTSMSLRLCSRAPEMTIRSEAATRPILRRRTDVPPPRQLDLTRRPRGETSPNALCPRLCGTKCGRTAQLAALGDAPARVSSRPSQLQSLGYSQDADRANGEAGPAAPSTPRASMRLGTPRLTRHGAMPRCGARLRAPERAAQPPNRPPGCGVFSLARRFRRRSPCRAAGTPRGGHPICTASTTLVGADRARHEGDPGHDRRRAPCSTSPRRPGRGISSGAIDRAERLGLLELIEHRRTARAPSRP